MKNKLLIALLMCTCLIGCKKEVPEETSKPEGTLISDVAEEITGIEPEQTPVISNETEIPAVQETQKPAPEGMKIDENASYEMEEDTGYIIQ